MLFCLPLFSKKDKRTDLELTSRGLKSDPPAPKGPEPKVVDKSFPTDLHYLHALARALQNGSPTPPRPGLPVELVGRILGMAECVHPKPIVLASAIWGVVVESHDGARVSETWFVSRPLVQRDLTGIARMILYTTSHDQGWAEHPELGSHSWFDVSIVSPNDKTKTRADGTGLVWRSHGNQLESENYVEHEGTPFEAGHEIWDNLEVGDRIAVSVVAQYGFWANHAKAGKLCVWSFFEPSLPPS